MAKKIIRLIKENFKPVLFVFLTLLLMVLISFRTASTIVSEQMQVIGQETLNTARSNVTASLVESQSTFSNIGITIESMMHSQKNNEEILAFLTNMNDYLHEEDTPVPDFLKIYAFLNGEFLDGSGWIPPDDYVPEQRPWYVGAILQEEVFFSEPYLDADTGDICVSFSRAIYDASGSLRGVLAIDLSISRILNYMKQLEFGNGSYGMVINNQLQFVSHKQDHLIGVALEDAGSGYRSLIPSFNAHEDISAKRMQDNDGTDSITFFRPIFNGWYLGLVIPRSSYYAPVYRLAAALGVIGFVLAVVLSALLLRTRYERMISIEENRSKSNFLSRMSHEMRTPMNAIIGMANIASKTDDMEQVQYCIRQIDVASTHLLGIINDVLDISKIESGKFTIAESEFFLEKMLRRVASVVNHLLEEKDQSFTITIDPSVPYSIISDEQRLSQVITNLLSNAIKFTPNHGDIELILDLVEETPGNCILRFRVKDSGIGIDPQQLDKLFQPFQQADNTISRRFGGTGLGLAISKSIVERLGGSISADSTPGKGSTFFFTIKAGIGTQKYMNLNASTPWKQIRILTVDDQPEVLRFMEDFAIVSGLTCRKASDALEAMRLIENEPAFDFVFIDYDLPDIDGLELCRRIQQKQSNVKCVLMLSNVKWKQIEKEAVDSGLYNHIEKPLLPSVIADCIAESYSGSDFIEYEEPKQESSITNIFSNRLILVAEDVEINAEILSALLEETGVNIDWVQNGQLAVEAFESKYDHYDLILMDIHMPELDGYEATRKIRALDCTRALSVPIVAMTANVFQEDIDRCLQAGMNDHIGKPLNFDELIATLKRYM